jgi:hypothetical protein
MCRPSVQSFVMVYEIMCYNCASCISVPPPGPGSAAVTTRTGDKELSGMEFCGPSLETFLPIDLSPLVDLWGQLVNYLGST